MRSEDPDVAAIPPCAVELASEPANEVFMTKLRDIRQTLRQVFGIPDYERYLEHSARRHPGAPVLSRKAFSDQVIERKYGKSGPRCC